MSQPSSAAKAFLMSLPSSVLAGMFCRFGSLEERRPVEVPAWLKLVWTLPVTWSISPGRTSE